jgi:hypothetical protein
MKSSSVYVFGILIVGFVAYFLLKDKIFEPAMSTTTVTPERFEVPAPASIEIRQAPIYPQRVVSPSGPNSPNQEAPEGETVIYGNPEPTDPYYNMNDSSDIPENLRHPERSFRPPPMNDNTSIAVEAGIASNNMQNTSDNSQKYSTDFIQNGGEFMPGIFATDTFTDTSYSTF